MWLRHPRQQMSNLIGTPRSVSKMVTSGGDQTHQKPEWPRVGVSLLGFSRQEFMLLTKKKPHSMVGKTAGMKWSCAACSFPADPLPASSSQFLLQAAGTFYQLEEDDEFSLVPYHKSISSVYLVAYGSIQLSLTLLRTTRGLLWEKTQRPYGCRF